MSVNVLLFLLAISNSRWEIMRQLQSFCGRLHFSKDWCSFCYRINPLKAFRIFIRAVVHLDRYSLRLSWLYKAFRSRWISRLLNDDVSTLLVGSLKIAVSAFRDYYVFSCKQFRLPWSIVPSWTNRLRNGLYVRQVITQRAYFVRLATSLSGHYF